MKNSEKTTITNGSADYLWDRTGEADPQIAALERTLGTLRHQPRTVHRLDQERTRRLLPLAAAAVIVLAAGAAIILSRQSSSAANAWTVRALSGTATIDSLTLDESGRLGIGQWLETGASSKVRVDVADIGNVTVHGDSRLRLLASTANEEHRLQLERGRIDALITAPPRLFFVNAPAAVAVDLGCAYTMTVDESGAGRIEVMLGWVALEDDGVTSTVPAGAACRMDPERGPGTPHFIDAPDRLQRALAHFDLTGDSASLNEVLEQARPRDALTLWHLLPRTDEAQRAETLDRMIALAEPPAGLTTEGVMALDESMLQAWWEELEIGW